jgi:hypothetical protein
MTNVTTKRDSSQPQTETAVHLLDNWFDPIEAGLRDRARESNSPLSGWPPRQSASIGFSIRRRISPADRFAFTGSWRAWGRARCHGCARAPAPRCLPLVQ